MMIRTVPQHTNQMGKKFALHITWAHLVSPAIYNISVPGYPRCLNIRFQGCNTPVLRAQEPNAWHVKRKNSNIKLWENKAIYL